MIWAASMSRRFLRPLVRTPTTRIWDSAWAVVRRSSPFPAAQLLGHPDDNASHLMVPDKLAEEFRILAGRHPVPNAQRTGDRPGRVTHRTTHSLGSVVHAKYPHTAS